MLVAGFLNRNFICDVCGECSAHPALTGIDMNREAVSLIHLCHACGPVDLDLMQICRELTIGCADN